MNCRKFNNNLVDWTADRTSGDIAIEMRAHAASCAACAAEAEAEKSLRASMRALPVPNRDIELWPKVAMRLDRHVPARRFLFSPRWATASALAAGVMCALVFVRPLVTPGGEYPVPQQNAVVTPIQTVDETRIVHLVASIRDMSDPDNEQTADPSRHTPLQQRAVLVGNEER